MKAISFTIYKGDPLLFNYYLRGLYFNMRMAKLLLPDWEIVINYDYLLPKENLEFIAELTAIKIEFVGQERCRNMMQRFYPSYFKDDATHIICRDSDSCLTYREMLEIRKWEESGKDWHGINDNPAHSIPMMGGMIGFKTKALKEIYPTFEGLVANWDLSKHGSDQQLIMTKLWPIAKNSFYHSQLTNREPQPQSNPLWESDLIQRYIGSAGVIEMELIRFLNRFDKNEKWIEFEKQHPKIFYWHD